MKIYIVVRDETDYNGDRTYPKCFTDKGDAQIWAKYQKEMDTLRIESLKELGEYSFSYDLIPDYYVEESEIEDA